LREGEFQLVPGAGKTRSPQNLNTRITGHFVTVFSALSAPGMGVVLAGYRATCTYCNGRVNPYFSPAFVVSLPRLVRNAGWQVSLLIKFLYAHEPGLRFQIVVIRKINRVKHLIGLSFSKSALYLGQGIGKRDPNINFLYPFLHPSPI